MQRLVDAIGESARSTRSEYHLTLGELIKDLRYHRQEKNALVFVDMPNGQRISIADEDNSLHSYRGYYSDLAMTPAPEPITIPALLARCEAALGATLEGYKGGDFTMAEDTPLWIASYSYSTQVAVMKCVMVTHTGPMLLLTKQVK